MKDEPKSTDVSTPSLKGLLARFRAWRRRTFGKRENTAPILRKGPAMRVIFFYAGEEGTYVENVHVTVFVNGVVLIESPFETTTVHHQNCEILWRYQVEVEESTNNNTKGQLRLLRRSESETLPRSDSDHPTPEP